MTPKEGGCLCGALRYRVAAEPVRITICHCRFCQRATGTAYFVEPIFRRQDFQLVAGAPKTYRHRSESSGKMLTLHFCDTCGTKLYIAFERFPDITGVYGGTFDDPDWFERSPEISKHIFVDFAQAGTIHSAGRGHLSRARLDPRRPADRTGGVRRTSCDWRRVVNGFTRPGLSDRLKRRTGRCGHGYRRARPPDGAQLDFSG